MRSNEFSLRYRERFNLPLQSSLRAMIFPPALAEILINDLLLYDD
jgi:hypothetical protein